MSRPPEILKPPDRCFVEGCTLENRVVLHLVAAPPGFGDFCLAHARELADGTPLVWTCECLVCQAARADLSLHHHVDGVVLCVQCMGCWLITTASGSHHLVDLDAKTITRIQDLTNTRRSDDVASVRLRRDGDVLPLLHFDPIRIGLSATLLIGSVDDYEGYISTTRTTTRVRAVERA